MMEPRRLLEDPDTPAFLREALEAVTPRDPSPEALARLHASLAQGAPAAVSGRWLARRAAGLLLSLGLMLSTALLWRSWTPPAADRGQPASLQPSAAAASERSPAVSELPPPPVGGQPPSAEPVPIERAPRPTPRSPRATRGLSLEAPRAPARAEAPAEPASAQPAPQPTAAMAPPPSEPAPARDAQRAAAPSPLDRAASAPPDLQDPQDEAGLLYRAKRLAVSDPRAALQLLAAHARAFPAGALSEERDVLAIRLHRRLGHTLQVRWLAAQFRAQYPRSVYLPSLAP